MVKNQAKTPDYELRIGRIRGTVWSETKQGDKGSYTAYSVKIEKSYKDGNDWKVTNTFFLDEITALILVAQKCQEFILIGSKQD